MRLSYGRARRIIPAYAGSTSTAGTTASRRSDHPRIRGEHLPEPGLDVGQAGSSPHTRGAQIRIWTSLRGPGIIPAYAGSTVIRSWCLGSFSDHPRIRGEHAWLASAAIPALGSSPHTRGAQAIGFVGDHALRIIPAYAGSTCLHAGHVRMGRDHPRIRGEHKFRSPYYNAAHGSSPHTRGAPFLPAVRPSDVGIIPAYAGSTSLARGGFGRPADHPRIRGEHDVYDMVTARGRGSSPHTRGAPADGDVETVFPGIIPAYAGSTRGWANGPGAVQDHPRIRGEHAMTSADITIQGGSSPHTRGAHCELHHEAGLARIIPAYAGSTPAATLEPDPRQDHPRIRGEHRSPSCPISPGIGSSPHTRGAHYFPLDRGFRSGIIPAYAGSTAAIGGWRVTRSDHPRIRGEHNPHLDTAKGSGGSSPHTRGAPSSRPRC